MRPRWPMCWIGAGAGTFIFEVSGFFVIFIPAPLAPALMTDVLAKLALDERGVRAFLPGSSQVRRHFVAGEFAMQEDQTKRRLRVCAGCGDEAAVLAVDLALIEDRGGTAKDEIDAALDVASVEIRPLAVHIERVLPAEQATVAEDHAITHRP